MASSIGECCSMTGMGVSLLSTIALTVTGIIAGLGILSGGTFGWISVGLGSGIALLGTGAFAYEAKQVYNCTWEEIVPLILTPLIGAGFVTLGGLGVAGVLSSSLVAWIVTGVAAGVFGISLIAGVITCSIDASNDDLSF